MSFAFCNASMIDGISISCRIMPGIAVNNAPEINACIVKGELVKDKSITSAIPHTILPDTMDIIMDKYKYFMFF